VPPASPDPHTGAYAVDARTAIEAVLEPLREATDRVDREVRDNAAFLDERSRSRLDADTQSLLDRAAESPQAPASLRRLASRVARGEMGWDDVFAHRAGPDGEAFLADAFSTARERFADADLAPVPVPEAALETGIDPDEIADDIDRTRREARDEHDLIFRRALEDQP
jgi:hypothetical protein